jgi:hypothetical protein
LLLPSANFETIQENFLNLITINQSTMTKKLLPAAFILSSSFSFAQLRFQDISFEEALNKSRKTNQLIFLQLESSSCGQCNEVANKAFQDQSLASELEQTFICLKITPDHPDRQAITGLYNSSFGSLFISNDKTLIHKYSKSTTRAAEYKEQMDIALAKASEDLSVSELEKEYNDNKSPAILEALLLKRKTLNLETDSLLDEYISLLPPDSLSSERALLVIAQMAPVIGSKPDQLLRKNYSLFNRVWYSMDVPVRVSINNQIISKSLKKAVKEKNESYAYRVAGFARSINNNAQSGLKSFDWSMLTYYKQTNDTANYFTRAVNYYDCYYMKVNPDSIKLKDSLSRKKLLAQSPVTIEKRGDSVLKKKQIIYAPLTQNFTSDLNNAAWNFYIMTQNLFYLQKATAWARRANEFYESPEAMDTYARLLYKTGNKNEALEWMNKAISLKKTRGFGTQDYESILQKMKNNSIKIDNY